MNTGRMRHSCSFVSIKELSELSIHEKYLSFLNHKMPRNVCTVILKLKNINIGVSATLCNKIVF